MKILTFLAVLFLCISANAQVKLDKLFCKAALADDVEYFFSMLEKVHISLYEYYPKDYVLAVKKEIEQQLADSMSLGNFHKMMELKTNSLFDEHTGVKYYFRAQTIPESAFVFPPDIVRVERGKLYFIENNSMYEVALLNGMQPDSIVNTMRLILGADKTLYTKDYTIENNFPMYYYHLYGESNMFNIVILQNGKSVNRKIQGQPKYKALEGFKTNVLPFEIIIKNNIAWLKVNTFTLSLENEFETFLVDCFNKIEENEIRFLFIDITENSGGSTNNVKQLLDYIYPQDYRFIYGYTKRRYSDVYFENAKQYFFSEYNSKEEAMKEYEEWRLSITSEAEEYGSDWLRNKKAVSPYLGKLFLVQSYKTASAALDFSAAIKASNRGLVIGEPTGDPIYSFSESFTDLEMPNTKIGFKCALGFFALAGGGYNSNVGVVPNIPYSYRELKLDESLMFRLFATIIEKYGNWQNDIDVAKIFR